MVDKTHQKTKSKPKKMKPRFLAAFIFLSATTMLLMVVSIVFFSYAPVRMQLNTWSKQMSPSMIVQHIARLALPQQSGQASSPALSPTLGPISTPTAIQPTVDPGAFHADLNQASAAPTPMPIYQVVEDKPPEGNLVIPSLDIDQPLVPVAVSEQQWDLEELGTQVGWLQTTGTHPGDDLAMVLIGHITLPYPGGAGPFLNLNTLQIGDIVKYRIGQETYVYQVKSQAVVNPDMVESLYQRGGNKLLLLTCTGYNALERKYDRRLLIEAALVRVEVDELSGSIY